MNKVMRLTQRSRGVLLSAHIALSLALAISCGHGSAEAQSPNLVEGDLSGLTDEFDRADSLTNWQRVEKLERWNNNQLERFDIANGWLTMMPYTSTWYRDYRGVLVFKPVPGDFVVTTRLRVSRRGGGGPPRSQFSLAGIMVRAPRTITPETWRTGGENYTFLSLGAADTPGTYQFEVKTTRNSDSQLVIRPGGASNGEAIIRVVRIGPYIITLKNVAGQWTVHQRYTRQDFPSTLQVGLTCYTDWPNASQLQPFQHNQSVIRSGSPDLVAQFDYVRYARPPASLLNRRLDDANAVTDSQIIEALGR